MHTSNQGMLLALTLTHDWLSVRQARCVPTDVAMPVLCMLVCCLHPLPSPPLPLPPLPYPASTLHVSN